MKDFLLTDWRQFVSIVVNVKGLPLQCITNADGYHIFAIEAGQVCWSINLVKGSKEAAEFEKKFKKGCNRRIDTAK